MERHILRGKWNKVMLCPGKEGENEITYAYRATNQTMDFLVIFLRQEKLKETFTKFPFPRT